MSARPFVFALLASITPLSAASVNERLARLEAEVAQLRALLGQRQNREIYEPEPLVSPTQKTHQIRSGDSYWSIARRNQISIEDLKRANPGVNPRSLRIGRTIVIPGRVVAKSTSPSPPTESGTYRVKKGDILGRISEAHGIRLHQLLAANPGLNPRRLQIGAVLQIPGSRPPLPPGEHESFKPIPREQPEREPEAPAPLSRPERGNPFLSDLDLDRPEARRLDDKISLLADPEPRLIRIEANTRFEDIATTHETTVTVLNKLNNQTLSPLQMIRAGSEIYVPKR